MSKEKTPSFIVELPLRSLPQEENELLVRLEAGRQLHNACLGELFKRFSLMKQSKDYQKTLSIPKWQKKERCQAFKDIRNRFGFKDSAIQSYGVKVKNSCHIKDHLDVHTTQKVATRAFNAMNDYVLGKKGKPRFKGKNQLDSLEGKTNKNGIRCRDGKIKWNGLNLSCIYDHKDKHGVEAHGLSCKTKYVRIVRRKIKGKNRFYAQLIQEGKPKQKEKNLIGDGTISIDIGPSTIAVYSENHAELLQFCEELKSINRETGELQRKLDRQRRINNPDNYNKDGTIKKGKLYWKFSNRYIEARAELSELYRKQAAYRKSLHGRLANKLISYGKNIKVENQSYKAFQKMYGRSIGFRAPGLFVSTITRKAESAGGIVEKLPLMLRLSQTCHCGKIEKKSLSNRWHICDCGVAAQRDLYSAYLGYHVNNNILDMSMANESWKGAEPLLKQAVSRAIESANGKALPASFGLNKAPRQSGLPVKSCAMVGIMDRTIPNVGDDVAHTSVCGESPKKGIVSTGTPCLSGIGRFSRYEVVYINHINPINQTYDCHSVNSIYVH